MTEATSADFQRLTRRMNELQEENKKIIEQLNQKYNERLGLLDVPEEPKIKPMSETISELKKIDDLFSEIEERSIKRETDFLENLKKLEQDSLEIGKQIKGLDAGESPK